MQLTSSIHENIAASPCEEIKTPAVIKIPHVPEELQDADESQADRSDRGEPVLTSRIRLKFVFYHAKDTETSPLHTRLSAPRAVCWESNFKIHLSSPAAYKESQQSSDLRPQRFSVCKGRSQRGRQSRGKFRSNSPCACT